MRVAVNGMGIAGPTLAYWRRRSGHDPVIFERAPAVRTGGYLIDFWGLGYEIAERMGILSTLRERGYVMKRLQMVDRNGREEAQMELTPLYEAQRGRFISIARADLASALAAACGDMPIHYNLPISAIAKDGAGALVTLSDGRQERFDLVAGADGLHSQVRALAFGPEATFERFLDCYVAAFRIRGYPHRDELTFVSHTVRGRQAARVSLRDDETVVMLVCGTERIGADHHGHADPRPLPRHAYGDMGWEVPELPDAMDAAEDVYFDRVSQIHLPHWSAGVVALALQDKVIGGRLTGVRPVPPAHRAGFSALDGSSAPEHRRWLPFAARPPSGIGGTANAQSTASWRSPRALRPPPNGIARFPPTRRCPTPSFRRPTLSRLMRRPKPSGPGSRRWAPVEAAGTAGI